MDKKVSVIIPFYNGVNWLCEAVQSVLDQTYKNVEIIVVNDGSPENVQSFLDKYGTLVNYNYQENQGPAVARNLGMHLATGDYLAYLDSDDVWVPTKLEKQIGFMESNGFLATQSNQLTHFIGYKNEFNFDNVKFYQNARFGVFHPNTEENSIISGFSNIYTAALKFGSQL